MTNPDNPIKCRELMSGWRCLMSETSAWYELDEITEHTDIKIPCRFIGRKIREMCEPIPAWSKYCPVCGTELYYTHSKLIRRCKYHGYWKLSDKKWNIKK